MVVEVTRLIDRWLQHPEYGIHAVLQVLERKTPEGHNDPLPDTPWVCNDTEDDSVAGQLEPSETPALVVFGEDATFEAQNEKRRIARRATINVAYITKGMPRLQAVRDGGYVLRAAMDSLASFNRIRLAENDRSLNGVKILSIDEIVEQRIAVAIAPCDLWGFIVVRASVIAD